MYFLLLIPILLFGNCDSSYEDPDKLTCSAFSIDEGSFTSACCSYGSSFDMFDSFRDGVDKNISTKIIAENFDINITADYEGYICTRVVAENNSTWIKDDFNQTKIVTLKTDFISQDAQIQIKYDQSDFNCTDDLPTQKSTEHFAIRPLKFFIDSVDEVKVGEEFDIEYFAFDKDNNKSKDYNESSSKLIEIYDVKNCNQGTFSPDITVFDFKDGNYSFNGVKYDDVGEIKISLREQSCSDAYASIDCNDKNVSAWTTADVLIREYNKTITFKPYKFSVVVESNSTRHKDLDFTFLSDPRKDSSEVTIFDFNITAMSKDDKVLTNYNKECYAKDFEVKIEKDNIENNLSKIIYYIENNSTLLEENKNDNIIETLSKDYFKTDSNGTALFKIGFNFNRTSEIPISAFKFDSNITVTDTDNVYGEINNIESIFFYGRFHALAIKTNKNEVKTSVDLIVYCENSSLCTGQERLIDWKTIDIDENEIFDTNVSSNYKLDSIIDVDVSEVKNDNFEFTIKNDKKLSGIVHFKTPNYFWYSFGVSSSYSYENNSSCINHNCFEYIFEDDSDKTISSGDYKGGDIDVKSRGKYQRKGVKVFR